MWQRIINLIERLAHQPQANSLFKSLALLVCGRVLHVIADCMQLEGGNASGIHRVGSSA